MNELLKNNVKITGDKFELKNFDVIFREKNAFYFHLNCCGTKENLEDYLYELRLIKENKSKIMTRQRISNFFGSIKMYFMVEALAEITLYRDDKKPQKFELDRGICSNVPLSKDIWLDRNEYRTFLFGLFFYSHTTNNKSPDHFYPVDGPEEFHRGTKLNLLWNNPNRWLLLDFMIETTEQLIAEIEG